MVFLLAQLNPYLIFNRGPISALCSKNNPRNIKHMPACPVGPADRTGVVIFFTYLDLEQKSSFMDEHLVVSAVFMGFHTWLSQKAADCKNESFPVGNYSISQLLISLFLSSPSGTPSAPYEIMS